MTIVLCAVLATLEPNSQLNAADRAFDSQRYEEAVKHYRELAQRLGNGHLWYNLGNAYLRQGQLGHAIASYLQAEVLMPRDSDLQANLKYARDSRKDAIDPEPGNPLLQTLFFWHYELSKRELAWALAMLNLALWVALIGRLWMRRSEVLKWLVTLTVVAMLGIGGSLAVRLLSPNRIAVVLHESIDVHSGTNRNTVVRFQLHSGTELTWLGSQNDWHRVRLPDGKQGWVAGEDVADLTL